PSVAHADAGGARPHASLALVVASNRGAGVGRPDLHYADDDAARYYATFRGVADEGDVALVTRFDHDSEKLFPELVARAESPTRAIVPARGAALAKRAEALRAAGADVDFYFVFAGHGDVERGRGFLELEDGPFSSSDLETLLKSVPATHAHVILDSCN